MSVQFGILGPLEVSEAGRPIPIGAAKPQALLTRLLLAPGLAVSADTLVYDLWPDEAPAQADAALRTLVSRLRKTLREAGLDDAVLETTSSGYLLRVGPDDVDARRFERLVAAGRTARLAGDSQAASALLSEALTLWRGRALGDLADEPFARAEAARLEELRLGAIEDRVEADLALGRHLQLVGELDALVQFHPLREGLWRQRMLALYRAGRQADSLRAYQDLRRLLGEELGLEPGPHLARLEQQILAQAPELEWVPTPPATAPASPPGAESGAPGLDATPIPLPPALQEQQPLTFVGRDVELDRAWSWWTTHRRGPANLFCVSGEPGIGKTRLAAELARRAWHDGAAVLWGRCDVETLVPYQPFAEALAAYLAAVPAARAAPVGRGVVELTAVIPDLAIDGGDAATAPSPVPESAGPADEPETERYRLFDAATAVLLQASARTPVLLVLDDLQWADRPTLLLLRHLLRYGAPTGPCIVAVFRDTELSPRHTLTELLADLRREQAPHRLGLVGLGEAAVSQLLTRSAAADGGDGDDAGQAPNPGLVTELRDQTEGNPFFIGEILRHLQDRGLPLRSGGRWIRELPIEEIGVPDGVKEVTARRVSRLSEMANRMLRVAAVAGREFDADVVARAGDISPDELVDALDESRQAGVVIEIAGVEDRYAFSHALIRQALYQDLIRSRRRRLHGRVGEAIETTHEGALEPHLGELAYHFGEAATVGDAAKAVAYSRAAGARALGRVAFEEAEAHYEQALRCLELHDPHDDLLRTDLLLALGAARSRVGDTGGARHAFVAAAETARRTRRPDRIGLAALGLGGRLEGDFDRPGPPDETCVGLLEEALAGLPTGPSPLRARLLGRLAVLLYWSDQRERRAALAQEAADVAQQCGDPGTVVVALSMCHRASWDLLSIEERLQSAGELLELAEVAGDTERALQARRWRLTDLLALGDLEAADHEIAEHDRVASELADPLLMGYTAMFHGLRAYMDGRFDEAESLAFEALALGQRAGNELATDFFAALMFRAWWDQGRLAEIEPAIAEARGHFADVTVVRCAAVFVDTELGRLDRARSAMDELAAHDFEDLPRDVMWPLCVTFLADVCAETGDAPRAAALYRRLLSYEGRLIVVGPPVAMCCGPVDHYLGLLAATMGDDAVAARHLEAALELGSEPFSARTRYAYAALLGRGDDVAGPRARQLLREVVETAGRLGMRPLAEKARDRLASLVPET